jgi:hypothetical protein
MTSFARFISILCHPFAMTLVMVLGVALRLSTPRAALQTVLLVAACAIVPVAVLMIRQVRKGTWENVDASRKSERPVLFGVAIIALLLLIGAAMLLKPASFLARGTIGVLIMLAVCAAANRWMKLSLHMAFAALATTMLFCIGSVIGWFLLPLMPLLAWSRLSLQRHRISEVALGSLVGIASALGLYYW